MHILDMRLLFLFLCIGFIICTHDVLGYCSAVECNTQCAAIRIQFTLKQAVEYKAAHSPSMVVQELKRFQSCKPVPEE